MPLLELNTKIYRRFFFRLLVGAVCATAGIAIGGPTTWSSDHTTSDHTTIGSLLELGEGKFKTSEEPLKSFLRQNRWKHNLTLVGKGPGVTEIYGKIRTDGWYPNFRHFSHYPDPDVRTGWALLEINNPGTVYMQDIWSHPPAGTTGIVVRTTDFGIVPDQLRWPNRNAAIGGARFTVSNFYSVYVYGKGSGMSFTDQRTGEVPAPGQFSNHIRLFGGHIVTADTALRIGGGKKAGNIYAGVMMIGFHIDVMAPGKGLRISDNTYLTIFAPGSIEPGWLLRKNGGSYINGPRENITVVGSWPIGGHIPRRTSP